MKDIETIKIYKFFGLEFKNLNEAASYFGVSKQYMSLVFNGSRKPSKAILDKLGLKKVVEVKYVKK